MSKIQPYTPADLARLRSLQARPQGWSNRVRPKVTESRHPITGERIKVVLDELGNKTRMRRHGQDVKIMAVPAVLARLENGRLINMGELK